MNDGQRVGDELVNDTPHHVFCMCPDCVPDIAEYVMAEGDFDIDADTV